MYICIHTNTKNMSDKTFKEKTRNIKFDFFNPIDSITGKRNSSTPIHMDPVMATFGEDDDDELGGNVQGGLVGIVVNFKNGKKVRITTQQLVNFAIEVANEK